jgi:hypothetical protein
VPSRPPGTRSYAAAVINERLPFEIAVEIEMIARVRG